MCHRQNNCVLVGGWAERDGQGEKGGKDNTRLGRIREGEKRKRNWKTFRMQING